MFFLLKLIKNYIWVYGIYQIFNLFSYGTALKSIWPLWTDFKSPPCSSLACFVVHCNLLCYTEDTLVFMALSLSQKSGQNTPLWEHSPWHITTMPLTKMLLPRQMEWLHPVSSKWRTSGLWDGPLGVDGVAPGRREIILIHQEGFLARDGLRAVYIRDTEMRCAQCTPCYGKLCPWSLLFLDAVVMRFLPITLQYWLDTLGQNHWSWADVRQKATTVRHAYMWSGPCMHVWVGKRGVRAELRARGSRPAPCGGV